jgi:uncharacterized protein YdiU (UPF0061 family)
MPCRIVPAPAIFVHVAVNVNFCRSQGRHRSRTASAAAAVQRFAVRAAGRRARDGSAVADVMSDCDAVREVDRCRVTGKKKYYCNTMPLAMAYSGYGNVSVSARSRRCWESTI